MHIRTHTDHLPGPLAEGNHATDQLTAHMHSNVIEFHNYSHATWRAPKAGFKLATQEAKEIISQCNICQKFNTSHLPQGKTLIVITNGKWMLLIFLILNVSISYIIL